MKLVLSQLRDEFRWSVVKQLEKNAVGPSESGHILRVSGGNVRFSGSGDDIVFLAKHVIASKILQDHRQKFKSDAVGIGIKSIAPQSFHCQQMNRSPAVGIIPLRVRLVAAHRQATRLLE